MRCQCCNKNLSDYESTLRHPVTGEFLDICKKCLVDIPIEPVEPARRVDDNDYDVDDEIDSINTELDFYRNYDNDDL